MKVKYIFRAYDEETEALDDIEYWIRHNISSGGIEVQIKKLIKLVSSLIAKHLESNPKDIYEIAEIVDCDGHDHKIVNEDSKSE